MRGPPRELPPQVNPAAPRRQLTRLRAGRYITKIDYIKFLKKRLSESALRYGEVMCRNMKLVLMSTKQQNGEIASRKDGARSNLLRGAWNMTRIQLSLSDVAPHRFARSQWQTSHRPCLTYLVYRWLLLIFLIATVIASYAGQTITYPDDYVGEPVELYYNKWFVYLTNWGFMLILLQATLALVVVHKNWTDNELSIACESGRSSDCSEENFGEQADGKRIVTPLLCRVYWLTNTVSADLAFVISMVYWLLVHDPKLSPVNALNVLVHGANSAVMLLEILVTSLPVRPFHAFYTIMLGVIYSTFSALYFLAGGTDRMGQPAIYKYLDWRRTGIALGFVALTATSMCVAHAVQLLLVWMRTRIASRCHRRQQAPRLDKLSKLVVE